MAPARRGTRKQIAYKKGQFIEYDYKGSTVTGKLCKKSPDSTDAKPIWIVTPSDRRRRDEEIPEKMLGKVITAQEAAMNRGPKLKPVKSTSTTESSSPTSKNSNSEDDESVDEPQDPAPKRRSGRGSPSDSKTSGSNVGSGKRKSSDDSNGGSDGRVNKVQKLVSFSQETNTTDTSVDKKKISTDKNKSNPSRRKIGTRSKGGTSEMMLLPELPKKKAPPKMKKIKKDENVTVVKMLTGCLYLYRGENPRAEFIRSK